MKTKSTNISLIDNHLHGTEARWFAVYVKYKCEKYVSEHLSKKGIANYVPLITKTKRYTSRVKSHRIPLINSYVFVYITKGEYVSVLETQYVMGFLKQRQHLISIPQREIDILKMVVGEIEHVSVHPISLAVGDEVEIIGGNLTGVKGILEEQDGKNRFVIQLQSVGMQLSMSVEMNKLRLIKRRAALQ